MGSGFGYEPFDEDARNYGPIGFVSDKVVKAAVRNMRAEDAARGHFNDAGKTREEGGVVRTLNGKVMTDQPRADWKRMMVNDDYDGAIKFVDERLEELEHGVPAHFDEREAELKAALASLKDERKAAEAEVAEQVAVWTKRRKVAEAMAEA